MKGCDFVKILVFFLIIIATKFVLNLHDWLRIRTLSKYHMEWLSDKRDNLHLYKQEIINLFKKAHVKNVYTPVSQPTGFGQISNMNADVFTMFPSKLQIIAYPAISMFFEAEGVFKKNMFNSLNPIFWIEFILFLPKELLTYLGINPETTAFKLCNVLLTFFWWLCGTAFALFKPQLQQFIIKLFGNL